jgi:uncharacterized repeat protein (TIGR02543 family)
MYVAVGSAGDISTSGDGAFWTSRVSNSNAQMKRVIYANNLFVAVGAGGTVLTSGDGVSWINRVSDSTTTNPIHDIGYGNSLFVAVGQTGTIITSADGKTWTSRTSGTTSNLIGIVYADNKFVAVGSSGSILTSADGVSWTSQVSGSTTTLYSISYGNNTFVVGGQSGETLTSADGTEWKVQKKYTNSNVYGLTFGDGFFAAALNGRSVWYSFDGVSWKMGNINSSVGLNGIHYANDKFMAVGEDGGILESNTFPLYKVTYDGNGNTGGGLPSVAKPYLDGDSVNVESNSGALVNGDYMFAGWNTKADGTGANYAAYSSFTIDGGNVTLYAKWASATYTVKYDGNGKTSGTVPVDSSTYSQGSVFGVKGNTENLAKSGYTFAGWNTKADGTGTDYAAAASFTMGTANVTLYAKWLLLGDANGDGLVTSADALLLTQYLKGKLTLTEYQKLALDVNGDQVLDQSDVQAILAISVGKGAAGK